MSTEAILGSLLAAIGSALAFFVTCLRFLAIKLFDDQKGIITTISKAHVDYLETTSKLITAQAASVDEIHTKTDKTHQVLLQLAHTMQIFSQTLDPKVREQILLNIRAIENLLKDSDTGKE